MQDRAHRQVRHPHRRLPVGGRGAQARRLPPRRPVEVDWIQAEDVEGLLAGGRLRDLDGIVIPGGFGERGIEGKIAAAGYAREHNIPCLGLCLGMQVMVVEYARNVLGLAGANSSEFDSQSPHPVIDLMESQRDVTDLGGTMRLGAYVAELDPRLAGGREPTAKTVVSERHRHRYEFNPKYRSRFEELGAARHRHLARRAPRGVRRARRPPLLDRHAGPPEFKSRPTRPAPLFREFIGAALARAEGRKPHLFEVPESATTAAADVRSSPPVRRAPPA